MIQIAKADGTSEAFDPHKLTASLRRAGASAGVADHIAREVEKELYNGITTGEIYSHAFSHLRHEGHGRAARYSLKRAMLDFGPSGFPFESYIAELFRAEGSSVLVDQIIQGGCVEHEVDIVVQSGAETVYVEAKFHNTLGFATDLKTVLYVQARIEDIAKRHPGAKGLVVTNTKFTDRAIAYAQCRGLELLAWDYPQSRTLQKRIDKAQVYPVTALTTLSRREKMALLAEREVLCTALPQKKDALLRAGVGKGELGAVLEEVGALCVPGNDI
ncbi:MAG: restriction endonuclease [Patescibacteria group bacterium]|nr:restriction endonuclease [Patescibacteria group bacterium]